MSIEDQVLALFGEANPVSSQATVDELTRPHLEVVEQGRMQMQDTTRRRVDTELPIVKEERGRRLAIGLAAAALALVVGGGAWVILGGSPDPTLEEAAQGGDPIAVIQVFHQKWSEGDVDGALAFVADAPDARVAQRNAMAYHIALEPPGWFWSVTGCAEQAPGVYQCDVRLNGDPIVDALGLETYSHQFRVEGNRLSDWGTASLTLQNIDAALADDALKQDPDGHGAACSPAEDSYSLGKAVFNPGCGAFLAQYVQSYAATLTSP